MEKPSILKDYEISNINANLICSYVICNESW